MTTEVGSGRASERQRSDETWTILRLILWSAEFLAEKGVPSARLDAEHLLAHVVGVGRLQLYLDYERPLTRDELDGFRPLLRRRAAREPLQYILGHQPFRELELEVTPAALIPRSETEVLVEAILEWAKSTERTGLHGLDVGTGTGAIALSLAIEGSFASVLATDIDPGALELAKRNRDSADLGDRVELRLGSLFDALAPDERFDVVVSNPPYVAEADRGGLEPEVVDWEPQQALFGGVDGLDVLRGLVAGGSGALRRGGLFALEIGAGQAGAVAEMMERAGAYEDVRVRRDYAGKERIVLAQRS